MKKMNRKGFTIVELVIVIAVIAILAAVLIPTFSGITNRAKESARIQETRNAMMEYLAEPENNGVIAENTVFYHFADGMPEENATVEAYPFTYADGKLTAGEKESVAVTVTTGEDDAKTYTATIDEEAVEFVATTNEKVFVKTVVEQDDDGDGE